MESHEFDQRATWFIAQTHSHEFEATIGLWFRHATIYTAKRKSDPVMECVAPAPENRLFPIVTRAIRRVLGRLGNRNNEVDDPKAQARSAHAVSIGMASLVCVAPRRCRGRRRGIGILGMDGDRRTQMGVRQIYRPAEMALSASAVLQRPTTAGIRGRPAVQQRMIRAEKSPSFAPSNLSPRRAT